MNEEQIIRIIDERIAHLIKRDRITIEKSFLQLLDGRNIQTGITTGTKIGTATTQKIGFFNKAPVAQQADIVALIDNTSGAAGDTIATAPGSYSQTYLNDNFTRLTERINLIRTTLRNLGLSA